MDVRDDLDRPTARHLPEGYERFYRRAWTPLLRLAHARLGSASTAEDLVQDVLADAHRRWADLGAYDDPLAWARRAVLNRTVSTWRRRDAEQRALRRVHGRAPAGPDHAPNPAEFPSAAESDGELWAAVRALPNRQRDVVLLLWFEDLPAAEVGRILECGEDTVRTHWRRARKRLATTLRIDDPDGHDVEHDAGRTDDPDADHEEGER